MAYADDAALRKSRRHGRWDFDSRRSRFILAQRDIVHRKRSLGAVRYRVDVTS